MNPSYLGSVHAGKYRLRGGAGAAASRSSEKNAEAFYSDDSFICKFDLRL